MKKINWERVNKFIKNRNFIIAVCVFGLTMASIGFSYASFFTVKTNTTNQSITTGNLKVSYGSSSSSIQKTGMNSMSDEEGLAQTDASVIYVQNTGDLNATYELNIGYDMTNFKARTGYKDTDVLTPIDYIMVAVYEYNGAGQEDTLIVEPISIAELPISSYDSSDSRNNRYSILFNTLGGTSSSNSTKTYKIKTWLSDKATPIASYTYFYVNTQVVAEVENAKMAYNMKIYSSLALGGITLQNGSQEATRMNQNFTLSNIYPGTYNIEIIYNNETYKGNITIIEGTVNDVTSYGSTFSGSDIYAVANTYKTTVAKIIEYNNLDTYSDAATISSGKLMSTYKITGGSEANINLKITNIDTTTKTFTLSN